MAGKRKKVTTVTEELPEGQTPIEDGETSTYELDVQRADDIETVERILEDNGITNVTYRFYDNDGGYCYSSPELDYDRARRETKGGKNCKLGVFIGNKIVRMVPFPLAPMDATVTPSAPQNNGNAGEIGFLKDLLLKLIDKGNTAPPSPPVPTLADMTSALANLDTLRGKQESAMETFIKGLEFGQSQSGATDWKTDLIRGAKEVIPHITDAITTMKGGTQLNPALQPDPATGLPPEHVIKAGIVYLKKKAIAGVDPDLIVEWVVNNAEEYQDFLRVVLNTEFADVAKFDPEISTEPFATWFKSLFERLRSAFAEPDTVDDDTRGDMGNGGNPGSDGEPRTAGSAKPKG